MESPERGGKEKAMAMSGQEHLTLREREVLELLAQRWTNEEMAEHFVIDVRTIEAHVSHILHKLGYKDRRELWRDTVG